MGRSRVVGHQLRFDGSKEAIRSGPSYVVGSRRFVLGVRVTREVYDKAAEVARRRGVKVSDLLGSLLLPLLADSKKSKR